ncbi:MAG: hypothetical protein SVV67_09725 [Bacillota bacterium]|nr:hypothetical protein [Bacillota bacterium]
MVNRTLFFVLQKLENAIHRIPGRACTIPDSLNAPREHPGYFFLSLLHCYSIIRILTISHDFVKDREGHWSAYDIVTL